MSGRQLKAFYAYVNGLETLAVDMLEGLESKRIRSNIRPILNGQVSQAFRNLVPLKARRAAGAFFTETKLARRLSTQILSRLPPNTVIADIACGVGDLLLACACKLPLGSNLAETLQLWSQHLMGFDIHSEFIRATKARLLLLAISRHLPIKHPITQTTNEIFPMIRQQAFFICHFEFYTLVSHFPLSTLNFPPVPTTGETDYTQ